MAEGTLSVSVPFSMGTVLHLDLPDFEDPDVEGFSPLLDGDGVASWDEMVSSVPIYPFQSPSRWGRCCINRSPVGPCVVLPVSVPFSMGTVLHQDFNDCPGFEVGVSVPFSMGTV